MAPTTYWPWRTPSIPGRERTALGFPEALSCEKGADMEKQRKTGRFPGEVRERAVRLVRESEGSHPSRWAALVSVSGKIGCTAETLRRWVREAEIDSGVRPGVTTDTAARMKELEREVRELRQANEILKKASAYFAQAELDRPWRK